jgi:hypothetical protein
MCSARIQRPQKQLDSLKHVFAKARCALPLKAPRFQLGAHCLRQALPLTAVQLAISNAGKKNTIPCTIF